jgi:putative transcriptional regulator
MNVKEVMPMTELRPQTKLTKKRKEKGMTQDQLAKKAKISRPLLSNIERGDAMPSLLAAYRIAKALDSTIDDVFIFFSQKARKTSKSA